MTSCQKRTSICEVVCPPMPRLMYYFNSYTMITDRTPELLSAMESIERITFDACHGLANAGVARLVRLPRLRELRVSGRAITSEVVDGFPERVTVVYAP